MFSSSLNFALHKKVQNKTFALPLENKIGYTSIFITYA